MTLEFVKASGPEFREEVLRGQVDVRFIYVVQRHPEGEAVMLRRFGVEPTVASRGSGVTTIRPVMGHNRTSSLVRAPGRGVHNPGVRAPDLVLTSGLALDSGASRCQQAAAKAAALRSCVRYGASGRPATLRDIGGSPPCPGLRRTRRPGGNRERCSWWNPGY